MSLLPILNLSESDISRFWKYVDKKGADDCWPWLAFTDHAGYGQLKLGPRSIGKWKMVGAHRISKYIASGPPPLDQLTLHHCDNPPCCNPRHLYYGTHKDNVYDCVKRERRAVIRTIGDRNGARKFPERVSVGLKRAWKAHPEFMARGEGSPKHKVNENDVREIRRLYGSGLANYPALREQFDLQNCALWKIIHRVSWRHIA